MDTLSDSETLLDASVKDTEYFLRLQDACRKKLEDLVQRVFGNKDRNQLLRADPRATGVANDAGGFLQKDGGRFKMPDGGIVPEEKDWYKYD